MMTAKGKTLAEQVREMMEAQGMTPYALAKRAGIGHASMSRVLSGDGSPSWETVQRLAQVLGASLDDWRVDFALPDYEPRGPGGRPVAQPAE